MPREFPYFIEGKIVEVSEPYRVAYVKVINGNVYHIKPDTPGIVFDKLVAGQMVEVEVTSTLTRVLSARLVYD